MPECLVPAEQKKEDSIDYSAGMIMRKKIGDRVEVGDVIATMYAADESKLALAKEFLSDKYRITTEKPEKIKLIYDVIRQS